jgi:hypothetical protein
LLDVDGAAISVMADGAIYGTFGSSSALSRQLEDLQFTFGEGPCLDAVRQARPVHADNLVDPAEERWPAYASSALDLGVRALYALPIGVPGSYVGVLDMYRNQPGPLRGHALIGALMAAELSLRPLLDLIRADASATATEQDPGWWSPLTSLARVEVYQATGMLVRQLGIRPAEALVRLRAHAFARDLTASDVASAILDGRLLLPSGPELPPTARRADTA